MCKNCANLDCNKDGLYCIIAGLTWGQLDEKGWCYYYEPDSPGNDKTVATTNSN